MSSPATGLLSPTLTNGDRFRELFYEPDTHALQAKTNIHLHVLKLDGGEFPLVRLYKELSNSTLGYVLSRQNYAEFLDDPSRSVEFVNKVQDQFRPPDKNAGEGGELLLYAFLESHLGAPKILSKMELKTATGDYIKGADGVHLLDEGQGKYQLIFGESKLYGDLASTPRSSVKRAVKDAFKSMAKVRDDGFDFDTWLVRSELLKEIVDEDKLDVLADILLPKKRHSPLKKSNSFGVFIGYEVDVTAVKFEDLEEDEIETLIRAEAKKLLSESHDVVKNQVTKYGMGGFRFHIYAVPFMKRTIGGVTTGVEDVRVNLAKALSHREDR